MDKTVYTVKEVAEVLGVTRNCVYNMISAGKIAPIIRIGRGDREMRVPGYVVQELLKGGGSSEPTNESPWEQAAARVRDAARTGVEVLADTMVFDATDSAVLFITTLERVVDEIDTLKKAEDATQRATSLQELASEVLKMHAEVVHAMNRQKAIAKAVQQKAVAVSHAYSSMLPTGAESALQVAEQVGVTLGYSVEQVREIVANIPPTTAPQTARKQRTEGENNFS